MLRRAHGKERPADAIGAVARPVKLTRGARARFAKLAPQAR